VRAWRGCGICRALVARRAQLVCARGVRYLQVDASDDSKSILLRIGTHFGDVIDERAWDRLTIQPGSVHPGGPQFLWATCLSSTLDGPKAGIVSR
jgi:hypothetical protein